MNQLPTIFSTMTQPAREQDQHVARPHVKINGEYVRMDEIEEVTKIAESLFGQDEITFKHGGKEYTSDVTFR